MNMFDNEISFNNKYYEDFIVKSNDHAIKLLPGPSGLEGRWLSKIDKVKHISRFLKSLE